MLTLYLIVVTENTRRQCYTENTMKRDLYWAKPKDIGWCCPGHDTFPDSTYNSRRSKKARSRDKKLEHRMARHLLNRKIEI